MRIKLSLKISINSSLAFLTSHLIDGTRTLARNSDIDAAAATDDDDDVFVAKAFPRR